MLLVLTIMITKIYGNNRDDNGNNDNYDTRDNVSNNISTNNRL